jgi:hypothetical protein
MSRVRGGTVTTLYGYRCIQLTRDTLACNQRQRHPRQAIEAQGGDPTLRPHRRWIFLPPRFLSSSTTRQISIISLLRLSNAQGLSARMRRTRGRP